MAAVFATLHGDVIARPLMPTYGNCVAVDGYFSPLGVVMSPTVASVPFELIVASVLHCGVCVGGSGGTLSRTDHSFPVPSKPRLAVVIGFRPWPYGPTLVACPVLKSIE